MFEFGGGGCLFQAWCEESGPLATGAKKDLFISRMDGAKAKRCTREG